MNKMIKLPLFLGIVGGICGGLLAGTHALTKGKIEKDENIRKNAAYLVHFADLANTKVADSASFQAVWSTHKNIKNINVIEVLNSSEAVIGKVYEATVKGFVDDIVFTVSFKDSSINKFVVINSKENAQGAAFIAAFDGAANVSIDKVVDYKSGSTTTYGNVNEAIQVCYADYKGN